MYISSAAPPPTVYDPYTVKLSKPYRDDGNSANFKSASPRDFVKKGNALSPGSYNVPCTLFNSTVGAVSAFKSKPRYADDDYTKETPGPGSYSHIPQKRPAPKQRRQFISVTQLMRNEPRPLSSMTNYSEKSGKTTKTSKSTLSNASYISIKHGPMPGHYDISKAASSVKHSIPLARSVFESRTKRFEAAFGKSGATGEIGPGFYQPIADSKRSFHLNLKNQWS